MNEKKKYIIMGSIIIICICALVLILVLYYTDGNINPFESTTEPVNIEATNVEVTLDNDDTQIEYEDDVSSTITLADNASTSTGSGVTISGNTITIKSGGTFYITGTLTDGNIIIDSSSSSNVKIILSNVSIKSSSTAAIFCKKAEKLIITLEENTTNYLEDATNYIYETTDEDEPSGALYSKADLTINGEGNLEVKANYLDGIVSKDILKIVSGNIKVTSKDDAIRGKDAVVITGGKIEIKSNEDGIKSSNDADTSLGYVLIENANITIEAGDDGIHAETVVKINSGNIDIKKSYEGIEGLYIEINGGNINVISSDDGINVASSNTSTPTNGRNQQNATNSSSSSNKLIINGGNITVDSTGDGLDSNGNMYITGGTTIVYGPTTSGNGALDYDGECVISGGNLITLGSAGMVQAPSNTSTQCSFTTTLSGAANDEITVKDSNENEIATVTAKKTYQVITVSNSNLKTGENYTIYVNGTQKNTISQTSTTTSSVTTMNGMGRGNGGMR